MNDCDLDVLAGTHGPYSEKCAEASPYQIQEIVIFTNVSKSSNRY